MFDTLWDVTRDKTDIEKKKLYLFFLVRIFDWLYFRVQMMCGDFLNCFRSGGVYIFRKFWVDMLYPGNEFTKSGYLRCLRRFLRRRILGYGLQKSFKWSVLTDSQTSFTTQNVHIWWLYTYVWLKFHLCPKFGHQRSKGQRKGVKLRV